jgi:hypothetical protein
METSIENKKKDAYVTASAIAKVQPKEDLSQLF